MGRVLDVRDIRFKRDTQKGTQWHSYVKGWKHILPKGFGHTKLGASAVWSTLWRYVPIPMNCVRRFLDQEISNRAKPGTRIGQVSPTLYYRREKKRESIELGMAIVKGRGPPVK